MTCMGPPCKAYCVQYFGYDPVVVAVGPWGHIPIVYFCYDRFSSLVGTENRGGSEVGGDLDCRAPGVRWLHTPLRGKAEAQGTRPSKPEKKGMRPIGNSRGIAVQVGRLLSGSGKVLDTFLCLLHESGLVEGGRM